MVKTDSVSIFAEGTFEEQIQELVNYLVRNRSDEERSGFIRPFQEALKTEDGHNLHDNEKRKRVVFTMVLKEIKGLGEGSDKEIEGFFNLVYSHLLTLFSLDFSEINTHVNGLLRTISSSTDHHFLKYRLLSNLFNTIPRKSSLRLTVYQTILQIAAAKDELQLLHLSRTEVETWLSDWDVTSEEKSNFLKTLVDAFQNSGQLEAAYEYKLSYIRSLSLSSSSTRAAAIDAIATALRLPSIFNFDPLFKLDAVLACKDHPIYDLLRVFLNDGLAEFRLWDAQHSGVLNEHNLDRDQLVRKIRLLTLASLGFRNIGQDLPYSTIAARLQINDSEVEVWVIDIIRAGLLSGKLSQTTQTLRVIRSTARTFEREQWEMLEKGLLAWKAGLAGVLDVIVAARKRSEVPAQTATAQTQTDRDQVAAA